jgi:hypothetical protein
LAALALYGMDWFNEAWNALLLHATGRAAAWTAPGPAAFLIFVGLNVESASSSPSPAAVAFSSQICGAGDARAPAGSAAQLTGSQESIDTRGTRKLIRPIVNVGWRAS